MKKISIIIPVYNTKDDIKKCIQSIINQTYSNLEIICIDDGSSDGTEKIIDELAASDSRMKLIHQKNAGESNARNTGLKMATGDYITFCDCDDWIDVDMYAVLADSIEQYNCDMAAASWYKETGLESQVITNHCEVVKDPFDRNQLLTYLYMRDSYRGFAYMWDKLYKKEVLYRADGSMILFDENLKLGGDVLWLAEVALNCNKTIYIDKAFYHYNQRQQSGSHTKDTKKLRDWLKAYEIVLDIFTSQNIPLNIVSYIKRFMAYHASNAAEIAIEHNDEAAKKIFQQFMIQYKQEYIGLNQQYPERIERYNKLLLA